MVRENKEAPHKDVTTRLKDVFLDLKRRVRITRKARVHASKRLREKHEYFEKVMYIYSLAILIMTIWFLTVDGNLNLIVTKLLLILSLSITYFTMFLNIKNYKERAGNFETNYQRLDVLLNKMERMETNLEELNHEELKGLHREYEKLLIDKENHHDIDYWTSYPEFEKKFEMNISRYRFRDNFKKVLVAMFPLIIALSIWLASYLINLISINL